MIKIILYLTIILLMFTLIQLILKKQYYTIKSIFQTLKSNSIIRNKILTVLIKLFLRILRKRFYI